MGGDAPRLQKWAFLFDAGSDARSARLVRAMLLERGFKEVLDRGLQEHNYDLSNLATIEAMTRAGQQFATIAAR